MIQRIFDVSVATIALVVATLPLAIIAIFVKVASPGPVIYRQRRIGRRGEPFTLYKVRTMRAGATGAQVTTGQDDRIYPVGRWLRRWKLDELPQFWNVLRGDMSIVGPRPEVERFVRGYTPAERRILDGRPGLASVSALVYADEAELLQAAPDPEAMYINELMPRKVAVDIDYENGRTLWSDLRLLGEIALFVAGRNHRVGHSVRGARHDPRSDVRR